MNLITSENLPIADAARRLGVDAKTLRKWKAKYHSAPATVAPPPVDQELRRLREEVRQLKMEREILKKAATFFAREAS